MRFGKSVGGGRRLDPREPAPVLSTIFTLSWTASAILVDVSRTGARLCGQRLPDEGEELILSMEGIRTYGTVAWAHGDQCGIRFGELLPTESLERLRGSVARARGLAPELKAAYDDWTIGVAR